jgi:hypothetical protein
MKLTDFPTEVERPSLPVTPAPIRRPSFWGSERDEEGNLPTAEGVPKQDDWVRRFSSYPVPEFPALSPLLQTIGGILVARCQFCGKQNPIARLEELQRRQSEVLMAPTKLEEAAALPARKMPESSSLEAVEEAVEGATTTAIPPETSATAPAPLKPILKNPTFGSEPTKETSALSEAANDDPELVGPTATATGVDAAKDPLDPKLPSTDHIEDAGTAEKPAVAARTTA